MKPFFKTVTCLLNLAFLFAIISVQAQVIQTVAGGVGEGSLPQNFMVESPRALVIDKKGNTYFYEDISNQVKKIDATTGRIKTVVGSGVIGIGGDNGSALNAEMLRVGIMAVDSAGNLYLTHITNNRIRKVNFQTGIITTVFGNGTVGMTPDDTLAYGKMIGLVKGIAFDKAGNIYFSESGNNIVRKVNKTTGKLSTVGGIGSSFGALGDGGPAKAAVISNPGEILVDDSSNIYVADLNQFRIRKISALTGIITTVAGNGIQGYSGDNGQATLAKIDYVTCMTFDAGGNLVFGDGGPYIRKVNKQTGIITTMAGKGINGYSGDGSLATNATIADPIGISKDTIGNLVFCDGYNNRIRKISASTGIINTLVGNGTTQGIIGLGAEAIFAQNLVSSSLAIDSAKNMYTSLSTSLRICKINAQTGIITSIAGNGLSGFSGDNGLASAAKLNYPSEMVMDKAGNIIFVDYNNFRIRKINAATQIITSIAGTGVQGYSGDSGLATAAQIGGVSSIALDTAGNIYFADNLGKDGAATNRIRKINALTGIISTFAGSDSFGFSGDGGLVGNAKFNVPSKVRLDNKGNVYIFDEQNWRIRKVDAQTGIVQTIVGGGAINTISNGLNALDIRYKLATLMEVDTKMNVYISQSGSSIIYQVDAQTGLISSYAGTGVEGFSGDGLAPRQAKISSSISVLKFDASGNAWMGDNKRIRAISLTAPTVLTQPKYITACINNKISFFITASCDSAYQWQIFQGGVYSNIHNNSIFSGAQSNTLSISILDSSLNNDSFRCVVYGPLGITNSKSGVLKIRPEQSKPQISGPIIACQDQSAVYSVPNFTDHTYRWKITGGSFVGSITKNSVSAFWGSNKQDTITLFDSIYGTTCGVSTSQIVQLKPKPSPAFTYSQSGGKVTFFPSQVGVMLYSWVINKITSNEHNPKLQFASNGIYNVYLKVTDSSNCFKDTSTTIQVTTVGVQDVLNPEPVFTIFPNPVKEGLTIEVNKGGISFSVYITDITGRSIQTFEGVKESSFTLAMDAYQKGFYVIRVSQDQDGISKSFKVFKE